MIIDFHTHLFKSWNGLKGMTPDEMLRVMDKYGVSQSVAFTMNGFWGDFRAANDELANLTKPHRDRLIPFCTVHPYAGNAAIEEMKRCYEQFGMRGMKLHPWCQGFFVTSDPMFRVAECAASINMMLVLHDGTPPYTEPLQIAHLARSFPTVTILLGHGGLKDFPIEVIMAAEQVPNLYVGTNTTTAALRKMWKTLNGDRMLFGSDSGFGQYSLDWFLTAIDSIEIPSRIKQKILFDNAREVLKAIGVS
jgi:predicted TIM-barrel fold metal-dependent hydrolase